MHVFKAKSYKENETISNSIQRLRIKGNKPVFFKKLSKGLRSSFEKRKIRVKDLEIQLDLNTKIKRIVYFVVVTAVFTLVLLDTLKQETDIANLARISAIASKSGLRSIEYSSNTLIVLNRIQNNQIILEQDSFWPIELTQTFGNIAVTVNVYLFEAAEAVASVCLTLVLFLIFGPAFNSTMKMLHERIFFPLSQLFVLIQTFNHSNNAFTAKSEPNVVGSLDTAIKMELNRRKDCIFQKKLHFIRNNTMILFGLVASIYNSTTFNWAKNRPKRDNFTRKRRICALIRLDKVAAFRELTDYLVSSGADCKFIGKDSVLFLWNLKIGANELNSTMLAFYSVVDGLKLLYASKRIARLMVTFSLGTVFNFLVRGDERIEECFVGESVSKCKEIVKIGDKLHYSVLLSEEMFAVLESEVKKDCSLVDLVGEKPNFSRVYGMKTNFSSRRQSVNDFQLSGVKLGKIFNSSSKCLIKLSEVKNTVNFGERNPDGALRVLVTNLINCKDDKHSEIFSKYCEINGKSAVAERIYNKIRKQLDWHL